MLVLEIEFKTGDVPLSTCSLTGLETKYVTKKKKGSATMIMAILINVLLFGAILAAIMIIPYVLATKGIFICGIKEGFVSILVNGVENGVFDRVIGSMKGYDIEPNGKITENPNAPRNKKWFVWMGSWPNHSAAVFDQEQVKTINMTDGTLSLEKVKYDRVIHLPIFYTERMVCKGQEIGDKSSKIDATIELTYRMSDVYTAKIKNRGSTKLLKSKTEEGFRELIAGLSDYGAALKMRNTKDAAELKTLVGTLNASDTGFGTLTELTGFELMVINIIVIELSGDSAEKIAAAYASVTIAEQNKKAKEFDAEAQKNWLQKEGEGKGLAEAAMVAQILRRIEAQKGMTAEQALAYAIERTQAQVVTIGGNGPSTLFNLESKKKTESIIPPSTVDQPNQGKPVMPPSGNQTGQAKPVMPPSNKNGGSGKNKKKST